MTLAILLHRRKLVSLSGLEASELGRALLASIISFAGAAATVYFFPTHHSHIEDLATITVATIIWMALSVITLRLTGSKFLSQILSRVA